MPNSSNRAGAAIQILVQNERKKLNVEVAAIKNGTSERPIPIVWRPAFCQIVDAFVRGDYLLHGGVAGVEAVSEEAASQIQSYLSDYGATLKSLPDETWNSSVCLWTGNHWDVLVDLPTTEEGASDLVLSARVNETSHGFNIEIHMVYIP